MYFNKSIVSGNLVRDPELRFTQGGSPVCELTIAVNRKANGREDVCYIDIVVWGKPAENCNRYLSKGASALVEGYLKQETWEDRNTGQRRSKLKLVAENVQFISSPRSDNSEPDQQQSRSYSDDYDPEPSNNQPERQSRFYGDTGGKPQSPPAQAQLPQLDQANTEDEIPF